MAEKIDRMEAEADAAAELAEGFNGDQLASKFDDLEQDHGANEALLALKAKMGLNAPAKEEQFEFEEAKQEQTASSGSRGSWDTEDF
jgi:phage shock protein A